MDKLSTVMIDRSGSSMPIESINASNIVMRHNMRNSGSFYCRVTGPCAPKVVQGDCLLLTRLTLSTYSDRSSKKEWVSTRASQLSTRKVLEGASDELPEPM